jgi:hypothetical protein
MGTSPHYWGKRLSVISCAHTARLAADGAPPCRGWRGCDPTIPPSCGPGSGLGAGMWAAAVVASRFVPAVI